MEWILILFVHGGILSNKDSMAITNVPGFSTEQECQYAGNKSNSLVETTTKDVRFICVPQKKD